MIQIKTHIKIKLRQDILSEGWTNGDSTFEGLTQQKIITVFKFVDYSTRTQYQRRPKNQR